MSDRRIIRLRRVEDYVGGPAWTDAELVEMLNAEQIVTLWTVHLSLQDSVRRPLEDPEKVRELIARWQQLFDAFDAARTDAIALRPLRGALLAKAREIRQTRQQHEAVE